MKFEKHFPAERLKPYIKYFVVSESELGKEYKVFPSPGLVIGFQYKGQFSIHKDINEIILAPAGITGISDNFKLFKNSPQTGTILVYFSEIGFTQFAPLPTNELFNLSISLEDVFDKTSVTAVEEKIALTSSDKQRIKIVELFLLAHLKDIKTDKLIVEAIKLIYQNKAISVSKN